MSLHDELANRAIALGKNAVDFNTAAQKHANATWIFLFAAGATWYFTGWGWALIPLSIGIFTAIKSVSSTMTASRIEKMNTTSKLVVS